MSVLCSVLDQNSSIKSVSIENNRVSPDVLADLFESIASPNNGLLELRVAAQQQQALGYRVEERIATAVCKNPRLMKAGITLEFKEIVSRVSKHMIANMDKLRVQRIKVMIARNNVMLMFLTGYTWVWRPETDGRYLAGRAVADHVYRTFLGIRVNAGQASVSWWNWDIYSWNGSSLEDLETYANSTLNFNDD